MTMFITITSILKKHLYILLFCLLLCGGVVKAAHILIPMDESQKNHLKAYGMAYWVLKNNAEIKWLLNYRGGSFMMPNSPAIENECVIRGISYQVIADAQAASIL